MVMLWMSNFQALTSITHETVMDLTDLLYIGDI